MSIIKSILLSILVYTSITLCELFVLSLEYNKYTPIFYQILPSLISYFLAFIYLSKSMPDNSLKEVSIKQGRLRIVLCILLLSLGEHIIDLPFFKWQSLSNEYFNTSYEIPNVSNTKFSIFRVYHGVSALVLTPPLEEFFFRYYIFADSW